MSCHDAWWCLAQRSLCILLFACGPSTAGDSAGEADSGDGTDSGSTSTTDDGDPADSGDASSATSSTGAEPDEGSTGRGSTRFQCGDEPCDLAAQWCVYCAPPGGAVCVDAATASTPRDATAACEREPGSGAVIVSCSSPYDCSSADESCMWTNGFGFTTVVCDSLACAATCSCTPQLRPVCDTLADCPACATACDDSLELGLPLKTCK